VYSIIATRLKKLCKKVTTSFEQSFQAWMEVYIVVTVEIIPKQNTLECKVK